MSFGTVRTLPSARDDRRKPSSNPGPIPARSSRRTTMYLSPTKKRPHPHTPLGKATETTTMIIQWLPARGKEGRKSQQPQRQVLRPDSILHCCTNCKPPSNSTAIAAPKKKRGRKPDIPWRRGSPHLAKSTTPTSNTQRKKTSDEVGWHSREKRKQTRTAPGQAPVVRQLVPLALLGDLYTDLPLLSLPELDRRRLRIGSTDGLVATHAKGRRTGKMRHMPRLPNYLAGRSLRPALA
jgi:hypothetical protein